MHFRGRFGILYILSLVFLAFSFLIRSALTAHAIAHMDITAGALPRVYGTGLVFDLAALSYLATPLLLYLTVLPDRFFNSRWHRILLQAFTLFVLSSLLFDAAAEYLFFQEFGTRFNFIAVDYLVYTREVYGNIRESYPLVTIMISILVLATLIFIFIRRPLLEAFLPPDGAEPRVLLGAVLLLLPLMSYSFVDVSLMNRSSDSYANELSGNGIYSLFAAFRNSDLDYEKFYPTAPENILLTRLKHLSRERNNRYESDDPRNFTRPISNSGPPEPLNIIVIMEESLSAEYLRAFGGRGLTPNLDALTGASLLFTHLYAAGTRTVRGLEAITLSLPPLPGTSLVKRPGNEDRFSWGSLMRARGYDTKFIYGGYGYFDNMNSFLSHNGFDIVDRSDFDRSEITFSNTWGVCDEDLFRKVIMEAEKSHAAGIPFFSLVLTTSNHRPFTYPARKVDTIPGAGRDGAVQYADYAIGRLIDEAKRQTWFSNTLFVIVADHCAGSAGRMELPVKRYEIPLIIYAPAHVSPRKIDKLASQIDVAPTVLGLLHFSYRTKFLGKDILKMASSQERAFISTYQKLGFIKGNNLIVLAPQKQIRAYVFDRKNGSEREIPAPEDVVNDALAYYQGTAVISAKALNRFP